VYERTEHIPALFPDADTDEPQTQTVYVWSAIVEMSMKVTKEQWYGVGFEMCGADDTAIGSVDGAVAFKNPYGYVPAESYGLLPFEVNNLSLYNVLLPVIYVCYYRRKYE
jgi:hypothetical protein